MLDFTELAAADDFHDLDLAVLARSQREEARHIEDCANRAATFHLPEGCGTGTADTRARLIARAYDLALIARLLEYMAAEPIQARIFLLSLRGAGAAQPVLQRAGRLFLAVANPEPAAEPMVAAR